jgi:hypothetical protein
MGVEKWGLLSTNVMNTTVKERVLPNASRTTTAQFVVSASQG